MANAVIGFAIGTGAAAGTAAAVRAWLPEQAKWADVIGAAAGVGLGFAARYVKPLKAHSTTIMAGAAISQTPRIVESLVAKAAATTGLVRAERLGYVQAARVGNNAMQLSGAVGGSANVGSHFGSVPLAGAH